LVPAPGSRSPSLRDFDCRVAYCFARGGIDAVTLSSTGPWDLPIEGFEIQTIVFASTIDIVAYGDGGPYGTLRLAGSFGLSEADGSIHKLDSERQSWEELAILLTLRHDKITSATVTETARLRVTLDSGRSLSAQPDNTPYENWEVSGPDFKLIAMPGNGSAGVAVFGG
jgi:hypothetical protein